MASLIQIQIYKFYGLITFKGTWNYKLQANLVRNRTDWWVMLLTIILSRNQQESNDSNKITLGHQYHSDIKMTVPFWQGIHKKQKEFRFCHTKYGRNYKDNPNPSTFLAWLSKTWLSLWGSPNCVSFTEFSRYILESALWKCCLIAFLLSLH